MTFMSYPYEPRRLQATEARLEKIMRAARLGLKGDALAIAAGMLPIEYRQLCQLDPVAEYAELKGRTEGELRASELLHEAAENGDAKATLAILQNVHGWVAKQQLSIDVEQRISITAALEQAQTRVISALENDASETVDFKELPSKQEQKAA